MTFILFEASLRLQMLLFKWMYRGCVSFPRAIPSSGTREGNWGSPQSLTSLFPGSFVQEQDTDEEMTWWLAAIVISLLF